MPRGGHKVKAVKAVQVDTTARPDVPSLPSTITKIRLAQSFLSRTSSATKLPEPIFEQSPTPRDTACEWSPKLDLPLHSPSFPTNLECDEGQDTTPDALLTEAEPSVQPALLSAIEGEEQEAEDGEGEEQDTYEAGPNTFECLNAEATLSNASFSTFSRSSASIYSRASSVYSCDASVYSFDNGWSDEYARKDSTDEATFDSRLPNVPQFQQRARPMPRRLDSQDAALKERSTLARKAALFKNSRLQPHLPSFSASLPTWSMVCRAAKASQDCYDSQASTRRGTYIPADSSKDIKAMIVDDQLIDDSRVMIVAIRGTQKQNFTDWNVNTSANPKSPIGFLDDEGNGCHAGFLQVSKAMVGRVATQLQQHPALSERPTLLFTGHSAGGAIAAMLYSHMLSSTVDSELTALAKEFSSISCMTFGAPPVSQAPLSRRDHVPGHFLAFANEGDLVLRTSNAAYFKSLARLMTASPPPSAATAIVPPPVKVVRGSRGAAVYRQAVPPPPPTPWDELPLWPTPAPSLTNAGDIILLRDRENGSAVASSITSDDLKEVIFGDLAQHTIEMYLRRVKELSLSAMLGRDL